MDSRNIKGKQQDTAVGGSGRADKSLEMKQTGRQYDLVFLSGITLLFAICVAAEFPFSRPHRKSIVRKMDEATLTVNSELESEVLVSWLSDQCYQCLFQPLGVVLAGPGPGMLSSVDFTVGTQHPMTLQLNSTLVGTELCRVHFHFGEQGNYSLWAKSLNNSSSEVDCSVVTDTEPVNSYLPLLIAFAVFAGLAFVATLGRSAMRLDCVKSLLFRLGNSMETERLINSVGWEARAVPSSWCRCVPLCPVMFSSAGVHSVLFQELGSPNPPLESSMDSPLPTTTVTCARRLRSLDTFRGLSLVVMVFVNYGGGRYWFFRHESWNGLTVADLVFPWFVFIMGTSIALAVNSALRSGTSRCSLLRKALWRSLQLFLIGLLVINPNYCQGPLSWDNLRIPGVLQRLAFSYLVVASLDLCVARARLDNLSADAWWYPAREFLLYWPAWLFVIALETIWLCLTFLLPVPDCPNGYIGPGGIGDFGLYPNCTGGAAGYIDRWLLGESRIYQTPSSRVVYASQMAYDPEGVLGSINSVLMAFLGLQAGKIILHYKDLHSRVIARFLVWGFVLGVLSAILTKCSRDQGFIPINKNLWSLSYVTTLGCFAFVLLLCFYYLVDVRRWWSGAPFCYPGMNSILVYVGHEVFEGYFPFRWRMSNSQSHAEHLAQNLVATSLWVLISYLLYRKKIFWKI